MPTNLAARAVGGLAILAVVGLALAWWSSTATPDVDAPAATPNSSDASMAGVGEPRAVLTTPKATEPGAVVLESGDADSGDGAARSDVMPKREPWDVVDPRGLLPRAERFVDRYANQDLEQIKFAQRETLYRFQSLKATALDERYKLGIYESRGPNAVEDGLPGYKLVQKPGGPITQVRGAMDEPGKVHVVWLPFEEYPEVYDLQEEWSWLGQKVYELEHPKLAGN